MTDIFIWSPIVLYGASLISNLIASSGKGDRWAGLSRCLLIIALLFHTTILILRAVATGHAPMARRYETLLFFSWSIALLNTILIFRYRFRTTEILTIPVIIFTLLMAAFSDKAVYPLPLILKTWWFETHVVTSFFSYALFTLSAASGAMFLFKEGRGETSNLSVFELIIYRSIFWGFAFFSTSMVLGAIWAYLAWGVYWLWEPKSVASLLLWFYFAGVLHTRFLKGWRGGRVSVMAVIGFGLVLFTYLGVSIFLTSSHGM